MYVNSGGSGGTVLMHTLFSIQHAYFDSQLRFVSFSFPLRSATDDLHFQEMFPF